ncbi:MAG: hypothetical protein AAB316_24075, partial [Bacteroidota bacterium]
IYSFTIPDFVSGQKLRATDLNQIVDLIEPPGKMTRRSLIGTGIGCGLEISVSNVAIPNANPAADGLVIRISSGAAVTSDGCLFYLENDSSFVAKPPEKPMNLSIFKPGLTGTVNVWELVSGETPTQNMEAFPAVDNEQNLLEGWCLVLVKVPADGSASATVFCASDLDPTGAAAIFDVCLFAIRENDLAQLWQAPDTGSGGTLPDLPFPFVSRLKQFQPLPDLYNQACEAALQVDGAVQKALVAAFPASGAGAAFAAALLTDLTNLRTNQPILLQYFWAYLKDWVAAFEEWALAQTLISQQQGCIVQVEDFPNFVALGPHAHCRMGFYPAKTALSACDQEKINKAGHLWERLKWLSDQHHLHFQDAGVLVQVPVQITGSQPKHLPLSQLAIPFYYQNANVLRPLWNFELQRVQRSKLVPGYERADSVPPFEQPLSYDLEKFEFYRVEGHVGKNYITAFNDIRTQRNLLNLPFKIVLVALQADANCPPGDAFVQAAVHPLPFLQFAAIRPGLEHQGGVPKGGTLVLIFGRTSASSQDCIVLADFCLPYSQEERPSALFHEKTRSEDEDGLVTPTLENDSLNAEFFIWEVWQFITGIVGDTLQLLETTVRTDKSDFTPNLQTTVQPTKIRVRLTAYHDMWESSYEEDFVLIEKEPEVEKAPPVAIFHERWRKYIESEDHEPVVEIRFDNDSVHHDSVKWKVERAKLNDEDDFVEVASGEYEPGTLEVGQQHLQFAFNVTKAYKLRITLTASNSIGDDEFVDNIYLCPCEMRLVIRQK